MKTQKMYSFTIDIKAVFIKQQPINAIYDRQVPSFSKLKVSNRNEADSCQFIKWLVFGGIVVRRSAGINIDSIRCVYPGLTGFRLFDEWWLIPYQHRERFENVVKNMLREGRVIHFDENGIHVKKLNWLHAASTRQFTYYHIDPKRGKFAMDRMSFRCFLSTKRKSAGRKNGTT